MIVYRCENVDLNKGPFWAHEPYYEERFALLDRHNNTGRNHPVPWKDGIHLEDKDFCGFQDIKKLKKWFSKKEREALRKWGWKFYMLVVDEKYVKLGKHQCGFQRNKAEIVKEMTECLLV